MTTHERQRAKTDLYWTVATTEGHLGYEFALTVRAERRGYFFAVKVIPTLQERAEFSHLQSFDDSVARQYGLFLLVDAPRILRSTAEAIYRACSQEPVSSQPMTALGVYAPYGPWEALPHHPTNLGVSARLTVDSERCYAIDDLMEAIARAMFVPPRLASG